MTAMELMHKLVNVPINYGIWNDKEQRIIYEKELKDVEPEQIYNECRVQKPEEVWKHKAGMCWDLCLLEWEILRASGYKNVRCTYFEGMKRGDKVPSSTHTFITYQDKSVPLYYWFEYSWYYQCGLRGPFHSVDIYREFMEYEYQKDGYKINYYNDNVDLSPLLKLPRISMSEFMKHCGSLYYQ